MRKPILVRTKRVIRDPRDATKDYELPTDRASELYRQGRLLFDLTNGQYCTPSPADTVR